MAMPSSRNDKIAFLGKIFLEKSCYIFICFNQAVGGVNSHTITV